MFMTPLVGVVCFAIIIVSWLGGVKYGGIPAGLVAIAAGTLIAWGSNLFGFNFGSMNMEALKGSFATFGFSAPTPVFGLVFSGFNWPLLSVLLVTAIPFGTTISSRPRTTWSAPPPPAMIIPRPACLLPMA